MSKPLVTKQMMRRHGQLIAELNDHAYNLAPPKSNVEMRIVDYDDVEEAVDSFYNDIQKLLEGCVVVDKQGWQELADLLKTRPRWNAFLCQKDKMKYSNAVFMWFENFNKKFGELTKQ